MAKDFAKAFYNGKLWNKCKEAYKKKRVMIDGGLCEICHINPGYIVHHKITLTEENINDPEISLNHELLSYECKQCHDKHEGHGIRRSKPKLLVYFDEEGQPIPRQKPP